MLQWQASFFPRSSGRRARRTGDARRWQRNNSMQVAVPVSPNPKGVRPHRRSQAILAAAPADEDPSIRQTTRNSLKTNPRWTRRQCLLGSESNIDRALILSRGHAVVDEEAESNISPPSPRCETAAFDKTSPHLSLATLRACATLDTDLVQSHGAHNLLQRDLVQLILATLNTKSCPSWPKPFAL